jgi:hypothetical protein
MELVGHRVFCTALVLDPAGSLACTYRKRAIPSDTGTLSAGDSIGYFDTEFGRVAVMICYDAESDAFVEETLAAAPVLVVNPIHIGAGFGGGGADERHNQWRVAIESMSRRMDYIVATSGCCCGWVRCDQPHPVGRGAWVLVAVLPDLDQTCMHAFCTHLVPRWIVERAAAIRRYQSSDHTLWHRICAVHGGGCLACARATGPAPTNCGTSSSARSHGQGG